MSRRLSLALICAFLTGPYAVANAQTPVEADYLRVRRAALKNHTSPLADLERRLRTIIGPVKVQGFPATGHSNLVALCEREEDCGLLDGLVFRTPDWHTELLVTTRGLLSGWLADRTGRAEPSSIDAALASPTILGDALAGGAAVYKFADLPVPNAERRGIIAAMLMLRAQDVGTWPPNAVLLTARRGNRVYIIQVPPVVHIEPMGVCGAQSDSAFKALRASGLTPQQINGDPIYARYRDCYGDHLREIPGIDKIIRQVAALADSLPDQPDR